MSGHTSPEPWHIEPAPSREDEYSVKSGSFYVATTFDGASMSLDDHNTALPNARRIVACVNACAGIPTSLLESMAIAGKNHPWQLLNDQREDLLSALEMDSYFLAVLADSLGVDPETTNIKVSLKGKEIKSINLAETVQKSADAIARAKGGA